MRMNHCSEIERLDPLARSDASTGPCACTARCARSDPCSRSSATTASCASSIVEPAEALGRLVGDAAVLADHAEDRQAVARPISKSLGSWPGVIFSAPVPNSGLT